MKRVALSALFAASFIRLTVMATPQTPAEQKIQFASGMPQQKMIQLTADNMQRDNNVVHCKGNVEVRITPTHPEEDRTVIRANAVDYHTDSGEIETFGDARVKFAKAQEAASI